MVICAVHVYVRTHTPIPRAVALGLRQESPPSPLLRHSAIRPANRRRGSTSGWPGQAGQLRRGEGMHGLPLFRGFAQRIFVGFFVVFHGFSWFCFVVFRGFAFFVEEFTAVLRKCLASLNSWVCGPGTCIQLRTAPLWRVSSARASLAAPETVGDSPEAVAVS